MNRITKKNTRWMPNESELVCSRHFVYGRPSLQNPNPTLKLGISEGCQETKESSDMLSINMLPLADSIVRTCASLCNLQPQLIKQ